MTDQQKFLDALNENPDDDVTRLVYADYLDDHDQPEEANRMRQWRKAKDWLDDLSKRMGPSCTNYSENADAYFAQRDAGVPYDEIVTPAETYEPIDVIKAGYDWLRGRYLEWMGKREWSGDHFVQMGSDTAREIFCGETQALYWQYWQIVTGIKVAEDKQGQPFSCSC